MGISNITSANNRSVIQMTTTELKDQKSKSIQNEITETQQQMQKLSSKEDLSVNEKANERKELQKKLSSLNTKLEQHQKELLRSQRREQMLARLQEDSASVSEDAADEKRRLSDEQQASQPGSVITRNGDGTVILKEVGNQESYNIDAEDTPANEVKKEATDKAETEDSDHAAAADSRPSSAEINAMVSADSSLQQAGRLGTIIARTSDGVAVLKDKISQSEENDIDTERQQAELRKLERQEKLAMAFQSSLLGEADNAMKSVTDPSSTKDKTTAVENNAYKNALSLSQEEPLSQQKFNISFV